MDLSHFALCHNKHNSVTNSKPSLRPARSSFLASRAQGVQKLRGDKCETTNPPRRRLGTPVPLRRIARSPLSPRRPLPLPPLLRAHRRRLGLEHHHRHVREDAPSIASPAAPSAHSGRRRASVGPIFFEGEGSLHLGPHRTLHSSSGSCAAPRKGVYRSQRLKKYGGPRVEPGPHTRSRSDQPLSSHACWVRRCSLPTTLPNTWARYAPEASFEHK